MTDGLQVFARKRSFSCIHRYEVKAWDEATNKKVFGGCFSRQGHGHNYTLEAYFSGPIDPQTGMIINLTEVDKLLTTALAPIDNTFLNEQLDDFKETVPTTENLLLYIKSEILKQIQQTGPIQLYQLRLYENEDLWVDWRSS